MTDSPSPAVPVGDEWAERDGLLLEAAEAMVETLRLWAQAYPVDVFPVPPEDQQARDSAAAQVMREMACPQFLVDADLIERLASALLNAHAIIDRLAASGVEGPGLSDKEHTMDEPFAMPDRIAIDAKGYGWRVWDDEELWSMVPTNPDNSPVPRPVTWFVREGPGLSEGERRLVEGLTSAWIEAAPLYPNDKAVDDIFALLAVIDAHFPPPAAGTGDRDG